MNAEMFTALGAFIVGLASLLSAILLHRKTMALLEYRLEQVEKKLDSHNGYAQKFSESSERLSKIETDIAVIKTSMEFIAKEAEAK
jgi:hypothetical protein